MKTIAMIPARYAATRFPGKLMQMLGNKTVIRHTYENAMATRLFDEVLVVTDSPIIFDEITHHGGYALMSKQPHESGSDRIAEAVADIEVDIVINVQGDEPFVKKEALEKLLKVFECKEGSKVQVASLMRVLQDNDQIGNPNTVKVVVDKNMDALMFSRYPLPYQRDKCIKPVYFQHIGVYAFRKNVLMNFTKAEITLLEAAEKIECLRYLENGIKIRMIETDYQGVAIDTPEDLEKAKNYI
jgi:3-deoxy-manno-octulosonate cytidylyltransferase (CMP-KDO synthetase)